MRGQFQALTVSLAIVGGLITTESGCNRPAKRLIRGSAVSTSSEPALSTTEPPISTAADGGDPPAFAAISDPPKASAKTVSALDRHPLLRKPQQYYDNTNSNKAVKTAAAAFIGVPAGIAGEVKQIFTGTPSAVSSVPN